MNDAVAIRKKLGLTQAFLAKLIGLDRAKLAMYETGKRRLPLQPMLYLSHAERTLLTLVNAQEEQEEIEYQEIRDYLDSQIAVLIAENQQLELKLVKLSQQYVTAKLRLAWLHEMLKQPEIYERNLNLFLERECELTAFEVKKLSSMEIIKIELKKEANMMLLNHYNQKKAI